MHQRGRRGGTRGDAHAAIENTTHGDACTLEQCRRLVKEGKDERGKDHSGRRTGSTRDEWKEAPAEERFFHNRTKSDSHNQKLQGYVRRQCGACGTRDKTYHAGPQHAPE